MVIVDRMRITERTVSDLWQQQRWSTSAMLTEEGLPLVILYPGRPNDNRGADFRDAAITLGKHTVHGDIEFHVKSSHWVAHHHHQDPFYNQVVLHVVMWHDTSHPPRRSDGHCINTLALNKYLKPTSLIESLDYPGVFHTCRHAVGLTGELLAQMGKTRFLSKAEEFKVKLTRMEAGESLYRGIMEALGYSQNRAPFCELARRVPLKTLEAMARCPSPEPERLAQIQALLLGTAGFSSSLQLEPAIMPVQAWNLFRLRPHNSPIRRLVAMSHLCLRYREGLLPGVIALVREALDHRDLEKGLMVSDCGHAPGSDAKGHAETAMLLGQERTGEIIINMVLPFVFAWSQAQGEQKLTKKTLVLYQRYPRLALNSIEKHLRHQLGLNSRLVKFAVHQQGLLHLYKNFCAVGRCGTCRLHWLTESSKLKSQTTI